MPGSQPKVLWGKMEGSPWWPCVAAKHDAKIHGKRPDKASTFVVFSFDDRSTYAFLSDNNTKSFIKNHQAYAKKSRSKKFKLALERAEKMAGFDKDKKQNHQQQQKDPLGSDGGGETAMDESEDNGDDAAASTTPSYGLSDYELARAERLRKNQEVLASLGLQSIKNELGMGSASSLAEKAKKALKNRGISARRAKRKAPMMPARRSGRIKGESADGMYVTSESRGSVTVAGSSGDQQKLALEGASVMEEPSRLPEETLTLDSTGGTESYGDEFMANLRRLCTAAEEETEDAAIISSEGLEYAEEMAKLTIGESGVAKVVPERIYSVAVHPSSTNLLVAAGDKCGNLGLWNVDQQDGESNGVVNWRPHLATINWMQFEGSTGTKLYTASYDGQMRCLDVTTGVCDFVVASSADDDGGWLQHGCLSPNGDLAYLADSLGYLTCHDRRSKKSVYRVLGHAKKINTVSLNPRDPNFLVTGSLDRTVKIWDVRKLKAAGTGGKTTKELALLPEPGERSVNSASFSPSGSRIITVSQSNYLRLYADAHKKTGTVMPDHSARHDNKTGRYLAVFRAEWDPKTDFSFVIGSMSKPRQVEVYTTEKNISRRLMSLQDPDYLGSVQSRNAFHPTQNIVVAANSSGRVHIFR